MKLVDWDKVTISYDRQIFGTITEPVCNLKIEAPTVKAIPIEWIKQWSFQNQSMNYGNGRNCTLKLLKDWEKENGRNNKD